MYLFLFRVLGCDVVYQCWHAAVHFCATLSSSDEIQSKAICHIFNFIDPAWLYLYKLRPRKLVQVRNFTHFKTYLQFCIQLYVIMQSIFFFFSGNRYTTLYSSTIHRFPAWLIGLNFGGFLHINRTHKFSIPNVRWFWILFPRVFHWFV